MFKRISILLFLGIIVCSFSLYGREAVPVALKQSAGDTVWVLRIKDSREIKAVILPGWYIEQANSGKKVNVVCSTVRLDSTGKLVVLAKRRRLIGVDTTMHELRYTTTDLIPADYGLFRYRLNAEGKFERIIQIQNK